MTTIGKAKQRCEHCHSHLQLRDGKIVFRFTNNGRTVHAQCLEDANRSEKPVTAAPPDDMDRNGLTPRRPPHA